MSRAQAALLAMAFAIATWSVTPAGASEQAELEIGTVDTSAYPAVELTVTAPPGWPQPESPVDAFRITEAGGERPVSVAGSEGTDLEVVLVIDTSGSMAGAALDGAQEAAKTFIDELPAEAAIGVVSYATEPEVASPLAADRAGHVEAVEALEAGGRTATFDAVEEALALFTEGDGVRRTIVLLTDGEDNESVLTPDEVVERLEETGVRFHAVQYATNATDRQALEAMAEAGSGTVAEADDGEALTVVYDTISQGLHREFLLGYSSSAEGPTEVRIDLAVGGQVATATTTIDLPTAAGATEDEAAEAAPLPGTAMPDPSFLERWGLAIGGTLAFLGLALLLVTFVVPRQPRARLTPGGVDAPKGAATGEGALSGLAERATALADQGLRHRGWGGRLNRALEVAGVPLRPGEFVVIAVGASLAAAAVGMLVSGPLLAIVLLVLAIAACRVYLQVKAARRRAKFADQLSDTLQLLAGSLRAGYSLLQAVDAVAREAESPTAEEFRRLVVETRIGRDLTTALHAMGDRVGNEDFEWVVQAIAIHREVGGDLADVLDTVAGTIRERNQIRRQVKALSAEGRLSAWVLGSLPFVVAGYIRLVNPGYLSELTQSPPGWIMLILAVGLMGAGLVWLRKAVRIAF